MSGALKRALFQHGARTGEERRDFGLTLLHLSQCSSQVLLSALALGDIAIDGHEADHLAPGIAQEHDIGIEDDGLT